MNSFHIRGGGRGVKLPRLYTLPIYDFDLCATHACTLLPAALAFVSYGFVLVRVRVRNHQLQTTKGAIYVHAGFTRLELIFYFVENTGSWCSLVVLYPLHFQLPSLLHTSLISSLPFCLCAIRGFVVSAHGGRCALPA